MDTTEKGLRAVEREMDSKTISTPKGKLILMVKHLIHELRQERTRNGAKARK
jgi:hypothetical protein